MKKAKSSQGKDGQKSVNLVSKPFCDCTRECSCQTCPDIKEATGTVNIDSVKVIRRAIKKKSSEKVKILVAKVASKSKVKEIRRPSLLDIMNKDRVCNCEIMARAVRSDIHKNLDVIGARSARLSKDIEDSEN